MMRRVIPLVLMVVCAGLSGCGGGGIEVEGKVTKGGAPLTLAEGEGMSIQLTGEDGKAGGSGAVDASGNFKIRAAEGAGIPPGKYKVSYVHYPAPSKDPTKAVPPQTKQTSEVWDVSSSNKSFTLDIPLDGKKK